MKQYLKWFVLILIAVVPSIFITKSEIRYNASPCLATEVCEKKTLGTMKTIQHGFPASYDITTEFTPLDSSKEGLVDQGGDTNYGYIRVNVLFWTLVLLNAQKLSSRLKTKK